MPGEKPGRRQFLAATGAAAGAALLGGVLPRRRAAAADTAAAADRSLHVACNQYNWFTHFRRENRDFAADLDASLAEVAQSGVHGLEPMLGSPADVERIAPLLEKHGLQMRSFYAGSTLHEAGQVDASIAQIVAVAAAAKRYGTRIAVVNPNPIRWGGPENKNDEQLQTQAAALARLGRELKEHGVTLAYHFHDIELRHAAREFHHMMLATPPDAVTLCLDTHWVYRGAGNSQVALFDVVKLYKSRVSELHLRQSADGVWTEALGDGDIDYPRLADELLRAGVRPHLVIEQAVEGATPRTMDGIEAHRRSLEYVKQVFAEFAA